MPNRVVITGLGVITPNGIGKDNYWKAVTSGESGIKKVSRFDTSDSPVKIAGEVCDFNPNDYMEQKKAKHLSRFAQFALAASYMAIKDSEANISNENPYRTGVAIGTTVGGKEVDEKQQYIFHQNGWKRLHPFCANLISNNFAVGVIASEFDIRGPNNTFSTGCTSALSAIIYAYELIKNGSVDLFVAGGSESPLVPFVYNAFCAAGVLSSKNGAPPQKASRPFDKNRDGYVLSEGCGIIVMESLKHALKRKSKIYAEIKGYGVTNDAYSPIKMEPTGNGAAKTIEFALSNSGLISRDIKYINAHGTSSKIADKRETNAIKQIFGELAYKIPISSIKSMIGQPLAASGSIQVITTALVLKNNNIPPTINYEEQDPECDLDYTPNQARHYNVDAALINSFGLGGSNISMVLSKYQ